MQLSIAGLGKCIFYTYISVKHGFYPNAMHICVYYDGVWVKIVTGTEVTSSGTNIIFYFIGRRGK